MAREVEATPSPGTGSGSAAGTAAKRPGALFRRILFGAVLLVISCGLLAVDWSTGRSFGIGAMVAYSMVFGLREIFRMFERIAPVPGKGAAAVAGLLVVATQVAEHELAAGSALREIPLADVIIALFAVLFLAYELRFEPSRERLLSIVLTMTGVLYVVFLGSFVLRVRYLDDVPWMSGTSVGYAGILYLVLAAKGTDMFAFFTGKLLGRTKLIPWISPGKTVAGGLGGLAGAVLITVAFALFSDLGRIFTWRIAVPFGIMIGLAATAGDLVESLFKRASAVKDSGGLVPEFGGVLDIIDSILFVAPVIYSAAVIARHHP